MEFEIGDKVQSDFRPGRSATYCGRLPNGQHIIDYEDNEKEDGFYTAVNHVSKQNDKMTKEFFLKDIDGWCNHRYLLWAALEKTKHLDLPVLELGCGNGSTPYLQKYCAANELELWSYDYNLEWAVKFRAQHVSDWNDIVWDYDFGVVLVDHSPGEHRKEAIKKLVNARIVIVHDSEPIGWNASDYQVRPLFDMFQFRIDLTSPKPGAWATLLTNYPEFLPSVKL